MPQIKYPPINDSGLRNILFPKIRDILKELNLDPNDEDNNPHGFTWQEEILLADETWYHETECLAEDWFRNYVLTNNLPSDFPDAYEDRNDYSLFVETLEKFYNAREIEYCAFMILDAFLKNLDKDDYIVLKNNNQGKVD